MLPFLEKLLKGKLNLEIHEYRDLLYVVVKYIVEVGTVSDKQKFVDLVTYALPEGEKNMTIAEEWLKEGEQKGYQKGIYAGIEQGKAEGKAEDIAEAILVALETRFGSVPEDIEALVRQAAPEKLSGMLRRAFTTPSPQALFTDESWH